MAYVNRSGLSVGFEHLSMDEIIWAAQVPRSSVYRIWETKGSFCSDLMIEIAESSFKRMTDDETLRSCVGVIRSNTDLVSTVLGRRELVREVIRVGVERNYYAVVDSMGWQAFISISAALLGDFPIGVRKVTEAALIRANSKFIEQQARLHHWIASVTGHRMKAEHKENYRLFAVLCSALVEGLALRHVANPELTDNFFLDGQLAGSSPDGWTPASIGVFALTDLYMESDPDFDLAAWKCP
jgi:AcrR family transcriptional regulator